MKDLSLHIMDILQNSIRAKASLISITMEESENSLKMVIEDNGEGMDSATLAKVTDPFFTTRTTRKVGLGISLLKQRCELTDGTFELKSKEGEGTVLTCEFKTNSIDMLPLGDLAGVLMLCIQAHEEIRFLFTIIVNEEEEFSFDTTNIKKELEIDNFNIPEINKGIRNYLNENILEYIAL